MASRLYINNALCDLNDESIIAFTYTQDDLTDPTVVKNSYSQQVTLPGTPTNNRIFGAMWRADRMQGLHGFDPLQRAPFELRNDLGEIIESGYAKLDKVTRKGSALTYKVTLYGGLGAFLYALSYDDNGNKRTLADIDYLHTGDPKSELDFEIRATWVNGAWTRLSNKDWSTAPEGITDVINFAPAYEGIPDNFDADKGLIAPSACGLKSSYTDDDGVTYSSKNGLTLVEMAEELTGFEAKDLRSYLQRPVLYVPAFLRALQYPDNCGGYSFDCSELLSKDTFGVYSQLWMTLPLISSLKVESKTSGTASLSLSEYWSQLGVSINMDIVPSEALPGDASAKIAFKFNVGVQVPTTSATEDTLRLSHVEKSRLESHIGFSGFAVQFGVLDSADTAVAASPTYYICCGDEISDWGLESTYYYNDGGVIEKTSHSPWLALNSNREKLARAFVKGDVDGDNTIYNLTLPIAAEMECYSAAKIVACVTPYTYTRDRISEDSQGEDSARDYISEFVGPTSMGEGKNIWLYDSGTKVTFAKWGSAGGTLSGTVTYTGSDILRSGALVTKEKLLSTDFTPAEMLLSLVKTFGLALLYDKGTKVVKVVTRNSLYRDNVVNINDRIDRSQAIETTPLNFSAKWLDFQNEVEGGFAEKYQEDYGVTYGMQKVDTGYSFNADEKDITSSIVFKGAVSGSEYGRYYNYVTQDGVYKPSVFLATGNKQVLWSSAGETVELDIPVPASPAITYYKQDGVNNGYFDPKASYMQFHDDDKKATEGAYVLCFYRGRREVRAHLSDDTSAMYNLNEGKPCWTIQSGTMNIPRFERFSADYDIMFIFTYCLDFGRARELNSPCAAYYPKLPKITVYERFWQDLIGDRYDRDTRVVSCYVDLRGLQVGQDLLRQFYIFDNSLWVLNEISDYSPDSKKPVKCTFVRVQDKAHYLSGQLFSVE